MIKTKKSKKKIKINKNTIYKIDQSGKVEYTTHNTVVAFSNGKKAAILIKAKEKRILQEHFRKVGKGQIFTFRLFSLLIFLLLKSEKFEEIIIDTEYPGRGDLIKNYLLHDFRRIGRKIDPKTIRFHQIGKNCEAHWHSYYCFKGRRKAEITINAKQVLKEIFH